MSLSHLFRRRRLEFAEYGFDIRRFDLPHEGSVEYAQWLHPLETPKTITQEAVDAMRRIVSPGDFVIDIGAHTGDTTLPMALAAGPTGCVLALEPNPYVFKVLAKNASLNQHKTNIEARCYAATKHDGRFVFHYSDASYCNGGLRSRQRWPLYRRRYPLQVEGCDLERVLRIEFAAWLPKLTFVKVDTEGHDRAVLESIRTILVETQPTISTEVYRKLLTSERYALWDLLDGTGYDAFHFCEGANPQGAAVSRVDVTKEKHFDILAISRDKAARIIG